MSFNLDFLNGRGKGGGSGRYCLFIIFKIFVFLGGFNVNLLEIRFLRLVC